VAQPRAKALPRPESVPALAVGRLVEIHRAAERAANQAFWRRVEAGRKGARTEHHRAAVAEWRSAVGALEEATSELSAAGWYCVDRGDARAYVPRGELRAGEARALGVATARASRRS
jgi:hypothetical protein